MASDISVPLTSAPTRKEEHPFQGGLSSWLRGGWSLYCCNWLAFSGFQLLISVSILLPLVPPRERLELHFSRTIGGRVCVTPGAALLPDVATLLRPHLRRPEQPAIQSLRWRLLRDPLRHLLRRRDRRRACPYPRLPERLLPVLPLAGSPLCARSLGAVGSPMPHRAWPLPARGAVPRGDPLHRVPPCPLHVRPLER